MKSKATPTRIARFQYIQEITSKARIEQYHRRLARPNPPPPLPVPSK